MSMLPNKALLTEEAIAYAQASRQNARIVRQLDQLQLPPQ